MHSAGRRGELRATVDSTWIAVNTSTSRTRNRMKNDGGRRGHIDRVGHAAHWHFDDGGG
jgi:hypothetical protein